MQYEYERRYDGEAEPGIVKPDFSFVDPAGDLIFWEHLGMLTDDDYRKRWNCKKKWYKANGFAEGENLFTTKDDERGGLDMRAINTVVELIKHKL
jgi:hypothetical protein